MSDLVPRWRGTFPGFVFAQCAAPWFGCAPFAGGVLEPRSGRGLYGGLVHGWGGASREQLNLWAGRSWPDCAVNLLTRLMKAFSFKALIWGSAEPL